MNIGKLLSILFLNIYHPRCRNKPLKTLSDAHEPAIRTRLTIYPLFSLSPSFFIKFSILSTHPCPKSNPHPSLPYPNLPSSFTLAFLDCQEAISTPLSPAPPVPVLFIEFPDRAQGTHILADGGADLIHCAFKVVGREGALWGVSWGGVGVVGGGDGRGEGGGEGGGRVRGGRG